MIALTNYVTSVRMARSSIGRAQHLVRSPGRNGVSWTGSFRRTHNRLLETDYVERQDIERFGRRGEHACDGSGAAGCTAGVLRLWVVPFPGVHVAALHLSCLDIGCRPLHNPPVARAG